MRINDKYLAALNAHRHLSIATGRAARAMERLSSGLRINRAGDDPAGLAISERCGRQIRGLRMAARNAADAISLIQTAEGATDEIAGTVRTSNNSGAAINADELKAMANSIGNGNSWTLDGAYTLIKTNRTFRDNMAVYSVEDYKLMGPDGTLYNLLVAGTAAPDGSFMFQRKPAGRRKPHPRRRHGERDDGVHKGKHPHASRAGYDSVGKPAAVERAAIAAVSIMPK